nr:MAG TPA: 5'-3' exonuclease [Caudoviricetes sp.]
MRFFRVFESSRNVPKHPGFYPQSVVKLLSEFNTVFA